MSTAGTEASVLFQRWREHGLRAIDSGQPTVNYMAEWSPPPHVDPMAPSSWTWGNPAIGHTLTLETLQQESENPDRASFLRASLNLWVTVARGWIAPGRWPELEHRGPIPMGGIIAIEASLDDSRYAAVRAVNLPDGRTVCTIAFVVDTIGELYDKLAEVAADPSVRFAMSPSIDAICPPNLERRRVIVGYAELGKLTPVVRDLINQGRLLHTGETMLAEHVQRAVAVKTQNTLVLSSQRSPGPIELARCMVWAAGMVARPAQSGRPMIVSV
jgi:phage terminase large subunit-like protein